MLRLKSGQRRVLIERFPELANFVAGSLFFGQFLTDRPFSWGLAGASILVWSLLLGVAMHPAAQEEQ